MFFMKNPIYSLILLILNYSLVSFIFIFSGIIFLGLIFMLIYVGAVSILLIFTFMLLNLRSIYFKSSNIKNFYNVFFLCYFVQIICFILINKNMNIYYFDDYIFINWFETIYIKSDFVALSYDLFINNIDIIFFISLYLTFVLLVATSLVSNLSESKNQENYIQTKKHTSKIAD